MSSCYIGITSKFHVKSTADKVGLPLKTTLVFVFILFVLHWWLIALFQIVCFAFLTVLCQIVLFALATDRFVSDCSFCIFDCLVSDCSFCIDDCSFCFRLFVLHWWLFVLCQIVRFTLATDRFVSDCLFCIDDCSFCLKQFVLHWRLFVLF